MRLRCLPHARAPPRSVSSPSTCLVDTKCSDTPPIPFLSLEALPVDLGGIFDALLKGGLAVLVKFLALLLFIGGVLIATGPIMGDERMGGQGRKILGAIAAGGIVALGAASIATWLGTLVAH